MEEEKKVSEPQIEKEAVKVDTDENQPKRETPAPEEVKAPDPAPEVPEGFVRKEDYDELDEKYRNSSSEALILRKKAEDKEARRELTNEPAESDLRASFPDWDVMTDTEKRLATRTFSADAKASALLQKEQEREAKAAWNTDLELAIAQNPSLQGKEQQFKDFANKPTHRGVATDVLVAAFLHKSGAYPAPKTPSRPVLEPGNGGPRGPIETKKYSAEEIMAIQTADPKKYREMLLKGDFD